MNRSIWLAITTTAAVSWACADDAGGGASSSTSGAAAADATTATTVDGGTAADSAAMDTKGGGYAYGGADSAAAADAGSGTDSSGWYGPEDASAAETSFSPDTAASADSAADSVPAVPNPDTPIGATDEQAKAAQVWKQMVEAAAFAQVSTGGSNKLELIDVRVTVQIEGLRARTLVDHIYYNPAKQTAQGTFRYSLPPDSSVSYYAMFAGQPNVTPQFFGNGDVLAGKDDEMIAGTTPQEVAQFSDPKLWGKLQEAVIADQVAATIAYEKETAKQIDPALGEVVGPNTFEAKVYPIPAQGYNRVLIAYETTLPRIKNKLRYTFVVPKSDTEKKLNTFKTFEFTALVKKEANGGAVFAGNLEGLDSKDTKTATLAKVTLQGPAAGGVLAWDVTPTAAEVDVITGTDPTDSKTYTLVRLQPELPELAAAKAYAKRAVILLDTSRSENLRFASSMKLLDAILTKSPQLQQFQVVTFDAGARWMGTSWLDNTPKGRQAVKDALDGVVLEGATDFGAALRALAKPPMTVGDDKVLDVFVLSDGALNWGDNGLSSIIGRYTTESPWTTRFFSYRIGLGSENNALYQALAQSGGAVFNCEGGDVVAACATAHQSAGLLLQDVQLTGVGDQAAQVADLVVSGRQATLFAGGSLLLAGRVVKAGAATLVIKGTVPGIGAKTLTYPVNLQPKGQLAPRAWAEIAVALLVDAHDKKLDKLMLAVAQHFRVASSAASYLVLQDKQAYDKYGITDESAKLANVDLAALLAAVQNAAQKAWTSWDRLNAVFLNYAGMSNFATINSGDLYKQFQALAPPSDLQLPEVSTQIPLVYAKDVPAQYLDLAQNPQANVFDALPWFIEGERRRKLGQTGQGIRAVSTVVENHTGDAEMARLAGYQIKAWNEGPMAAGVLLGVLEKRPSEPQSYRDLAGAIGTDRPVVTAMLFEAALAGNWDSKFKSLKLVVGEEYALFINAVLAGGAKADVAALLKERMAKHQLVVPTGKLRVTLTWNTDATDIDLWVTDPLGEKCYYSHKNLTSGGVLLDDLTGGYGPEKFQATTTIPGKYKVQAHYYGNNGIKLQPLVFISATIMTYLGQAQATTQNVSALLKQKDDVADLGVVEFK